MADTTPAIDYTSKDYDGFKASLLDYAERAFPDWKGRGEGDFGVAMVEMFAYLGDILSFYGDRIQQESYLSTATQRLSLLQIADLLGYKVSNGVPATGTVQFQTANPGNPVTVPAGTQVATDYINDLDGPVIYETDIDYVVPGNGGVVTATVVEGTTYSLVKVGTSTGLPDQQYRLPNTPVIDGTVKVFIETSSIPQEWVSLPFIIDADPEDHVFTTYTDPTGATWVQLGDGTNGSIPNTGLAIYATYRVGGGVSGNQVAGSVAQIVAPISGVFIPTNSNGVAVSSAMSGGADPESVDSIRRNAPLAWRTQSRLVTLQDFEDSALSVPGVTKASATANHYTSVTCYITGPNGTLPNTALKNSVQQSLTSKALAGVSVTVATPTIVKVNMGKTGSEIVIGVKPRYHRALVQADVIKALQNLLGITNVDFNQRLSLSDLYACISGVEGVMYAQIPFYARADAAQTGTADIQFRAWEIPSPGSIVLSVSGGIG